MNVTRNRLRIFIKHPYYVNQMRQPPTPYIITEELGEYDDGNEDAAIGVNAVGIDKGSFTEVWRI